MSDRLWRYLFTERRNERYGFDELASIARTEVGDTVRMSPSQDSWSIIGALYDKHYGNNGQYKIFCPPMPDGQALLFLHQYHLELASTGSIADVDIQPEGMPIRSLAVVDARALRSIRAPEAPEIQIFPDITTKTKLFMDPVLDAIRADLPNLLSEEDENLTSLFTRSARHFIAKDRRAEVIWGWFADHISALGIPFDAFEPEDKFANGNDGGVDDLRKLSENRLLATQVKGGTSWGNTCYPVTEAKKFFSVDGDQVESSAFEKRSRLYPVLNEPVGTGGIIQDDVMTGHFLAFGKRYPGCQRLYRGKTWPAARGKSGPPATRQNGRLQPEPVEINRRFYVTGLDIIVLDEPEYQNAGIRIDMSAASRLPKEKLTDAGLVSNQFYDVPMSMRASE